MRAAIAAGVALIALLACGLMYQSMRISTLEARLVALEDARPALAVAAAPVARRADRPSGAVGAQAVALANERRGGHDRSEPVRITEDPELQAEVEALVEEVQERSHIERRERFAAMMRDNMVAEIERFAEENELSEAVAEQVTRILDDHAEGRRLRWESVHNGERTMTEAREEGEAEREAVAAEVTRLVGADGWAQLEERVMMGPPHRGPRGH